jgi:hypothetical protein
MINDQAPAGPAGFAAPLRALLNGNWGPASASSIFRSWVTFSPGATGERPVERGADYSWSKAAEYERRAQEATDGSVRGFLCLMRDNWVTAAKDFESERAARTRPGEVKVA